MIEIVFSRRKLIFFSCHSLLHLFQAALHLQPFFQLLKWFTLPSRFFLGSKTTCRSTTNIQTPVVRRTYNAIHRITLCLVYNTVRFDDTYPLDSDLSVLQNYPPFELLSPQRLLWFVPSQEIFNLEEIPGLSFFFFGSVTQKCLCYRLSIIFSIRQIQRIWEGLEALGVLVSNYK